MIFWNRSLVKIYFATDNLLFNPWRQRLTSWTVLNLYNFLFPFFFFAKTIHTLCWSWHGRTSCDGDKTKRYNSPIHSHTATRGVGKGGGGVRGINHKINTYIIRYLMETWGFLVNHIGATAGKIVRITLKALQGSCLKEGFVEGEASRILRTNPTPSTCSNNVQSFKMCLKKGMDTWRRCEEICVTPARESAIKKQRQ